METLSAHSQFGDYKISECLRENSHTKTWTAEQISVGRPVLIDELKQNGLETREEFLADVRAKAAVEHPLLSSIYEASTENSLCFFSYEFLPGQTLAQLLESQKKVEALRFVHFLKRIAEANLYLESHQLATAPIELKNIYIDSQDVVRIENLTIAGEREADQSTRDVMKLGEILRNLIDSNYPGTSRCLTLLSWMRGENIEQPLSWEQIRGYCEQIEQQLTEPSNIITPTSAVVRSKSKPMIVWVALILFLVILGGLMLLPKKKTITPIVLTKSEWIEIPSGSYDISDGTQIAVETFFISNHEVTIGAYAKFLNTLDLLAQDSNDKIFDHPEQPADKANHLPDDWTALHEAAKKSTSWNEREIDLNTPVVGVDWWDAYAYAKWQRGFLPTQEQWLAALSSGDDNASEIPVSEWLPVTEETPDRTSNGMLALAGSISEWTAEPRPSPTNPLGQPLWVIIGGSYLNPSKGALSREWIEDRSTRRPDLGFRIGKSKL